MKTPLHTRIYAGMAVALVAGALVLGGPLPRTDARAQEPTSSPDVSPVKSPVMSPLVLPVPSPAKGTTDPRPQPVPLTDTVAPSNSVVPTDSTPTDSTPTE
ncbi:MAG: hypothetical protein ACYTKC_19605, partial [Planctomycetota bacterium]